jgi:pimeloyl-ACP methyl ester carboxylesterase
MKPRSILSFVAWPLLAQVAKISAAKSASSRCTSIKAPAFPGVNVLSIEGTYTKDYTLAIEPGSRASLFLNETISGLEFCDVTVYLTHPGADDKVKLSIWLPPDEKWNGRFQATGGGGFATGMFEYSTARPVSLGFATASTDGGHVGSPADGSWAVHKNGSLNLPLFRNYASRSLYEMGVFGKAITENFYGKPPHHSYWSGCSTGGRQGYLMAQKYPDLFDGILANAPAINCGQFITAEMWPHIVMQQSGKFISSCVFERFVNASLDVCDELDGVKDRVIMDPLACDFDPRSIVGQEASCEGGNEVITDAMAEIVKKIVDGPKSPGGDRLWYALPPSTPFGVLARTVLADGKLTGAPFPISNDWIKYVVLQDPDFDWSKMTYDDFAWAFSQSVARVGWLVETDRPDLSAFRDAGGKLLTFHGLTDDFIPVGGTIQYRQRVEDDMGGLEAVDEFYRLFLAPGVGHCGQGVGPVPVDPLTSLVTWVEEGKAPDFLHASTTDDEGDLVERDICRYPYAQQYTGKDAKSPTGWECSGEIMAGLRREDANLDSLHWGVPLPEHLNPLKNLETKHETGKKDEL